MRRTNIYLTDEEHRRLMIVAGEEGITMAEAVRRILDKELGLAEQALSVAEAIEISAGSWAERTQEELGALRELRALDRQAR